MLALNENGGKNLTVLAFDAALGLIKDVVDKGFNVERIICDTVGPPETYRKKIQAHLGIDFTPTGQKPPAGQPVVIVESKADDTYPVVSAASIMAKVTRDRQLNNWKFEEKAEVSLSFSKEFGCGYPGDKIT
jgi:ribonuclease H2 subunit A